MGKNYLKIGKEFENGKVEKLKNQKMGKKILKQEKSLKMGKFEK